MGRHHSCRGVGAPAATGLKFPAMQGRIALPAPGGRESLPDSRLPWGHASMSCQSAAHSFPPRSAPDVALCTPGSRFLVNPGAIAPTSMHTRQRFRERAGKHFPNRHLPLSGRMRRAGVWSSARSSALRAIDEVLHPVSSTGGGKRRVGRRRRGRRGWGVGAPAATGLKFPAMQGRIALPAPSGCESPYPRPAPLRRSPCPRHRAASRPRAADPVRAPVPGGRRAIRAGAP